VRTGRHPTPCAGRQPHLVNRTSNAASNAAETPLQAAHRQKRGDLVGALIEAGADVRRMFGRRKPTPLAVCIAYGQVESVHALLRAGHDANEKIEWVQWVDDPGNDVFCTPARFCPALPSLGLPSDRVVDNDTTIGAPQISRLELLLQEGGAQADARDSYGETPIFWLARFGSVYDDEEEEQAARDLLVSAGARTSGIFNDCDASPLLIATEGNNIRFVRFLIEEAGASLDERRPRDGATALEF